ncbi:MAG: nitroreductase family protein [Clostridia bacterium]|nr:nitroreductase family protein [Clostridia bacterium]
MNEIIQSLYSRKSTREFERREITDDVKREIYSAACQAPTAGNQQLYTILDIKDARIKQRLSELCDSQPMIARAPMVAVFLADCERWYRGYIEAGLNPRKPGCGDLMLAVCDCLIAAQNAVVAAEALGVGACYIGDTASPVIYCFTWNNRPADAIISSACLPNCSTWNNSAVLVIIRDAPAITAGAFPKPLFYIFSIILEIASLSSRNESLNL